MKYRFLAILFVLFSACQTIKIKNSTYEVSTSATELGCIGEAQSSLNKNSFETRAFPTLENKIRVAVEIIPYNKKLNKIFTSKSEFNQHQEKVVYVDSLPTKPEIVTMTILDVNGIVNELNADYNKNVYRVINDLEDLSLISGIAINLSTEDITKIRAADAFYLTNSLEKKYTIALFKQGKKTESIELSSGTVVGYKLSKFCWSENEKGKWYIADIVANNASCKGKTATKIKNKKREESLYKM